MWSAGSANATRTVSSSISTPIAANFRASGSGTACAAAGWTAVSSKSTKSMPSATLSAAARSFGPTRPRWSRTVGNGRSARADSSIASSRTSGDRMWRSTSDSPNLRAWLFSISVVLLWTGTGRRGFFGT